MTPPPRMVLGTRCHPLVISSPPPGFALRRGVKRYPEPVAHGPEARKPMARRPGSRHTCTDAVNTVRQRDIPFL